MTSKPLEGARDIRSDDPHDTRVLVIGGSGALGIPVVRHLVSEGFPVRVLARDVERARARVGANVELLQGDVEDDGAVAAAVRECAAVHVSLAGGWRADRVERVEHLGTARVARAAAREGVRCLTYLSGMYVSRDRVEDASAEGAKWRAEEAIRASGVPHVILRPTYFMETLARHVQGNRVILLGHQPHPLHIVAAADFARMIVKAMFTPAAVGRDLFVHGPEAIPLLAALTAYRDALHPELPMVTLPIPLMRVVNRLFMGGRLTRELNLMRMMQRLGERGDPHEANRLLGASRTTVATWCASQKIRQHRDEAVA